MIIKKQFALLLLFFFMSHNTVAEKVHIYIEAKPSNNYVDEKGDNKIRVTKVWLYHHDDRKYVPVECNEDDYLTKSTCIKTLDLKQGFYDIRGLAQTETYRGKPVDTIWQFKIIKAGCNRPIKGHEIYNSWSNPSRHDASRSDVVAIFSI